MEQFDLVGVFGVVNEGVYVTAFGPFGDEIAVEVVLEGTSEAHHEGAFEVGEDVAFSEDFVY